MAYEQGYVGDPRGRETAVEDAADIGSDLLDSSFAESTSGMTLNKQKVENKLSFYLDEDQFGATYSGSPYNANININREGQINWGGSISQGVGPFGARVGLVGQGSNISPYANLNVNPMKGLNLNVSAQSYPGGYSAVNPSASYQNEFNTPWGPLGYNIGRRGGRTTGGLQVRGDF
jgi:hypothetical protein